MQVLLTKLETKPELEVLDLYFLEQSYVSDHQYSVLDVVLFRGVQDAWICLKGLENLVSLKRWIQHIDSRLAEMKGLRGNERFDERFDEDSVTVEHVIEVINKNMTKKRNENVSKVVFIFLDIHWLLIFQSLL